MKFEAVVGSAGRRVAVERLDDKRFLVGDKERTVGVEVLENGIYSLIIDGCSYEVSVREERKGVLVEIGAHAIPVQLQDPSQAVGEGVGEIAKGEAVIASPMPGRIVGIKVAEGETVQEGRGVILVEAMKMENELHAPKTGKVMKIAVKVGDAVEAGQELVVIE